MNNDKGESGERRALHSVTIQWCSRDQSLTPTLSGVDCTLFLRRALSICLT